MLTMFGAGWQVRFAASRLQALGGAAAGSDPPPPPPHEASRPAISHGAARIAIDLIEPLPDLDLTTRLSCTGPCRDQRIGDLGESGPAFAARDVGRPHQ